MSLFMLFNIVFKSGKNPEAWSIGFICPVYKGKGDAADIDNYRGITVLSCIGKLFTNGLNERIYAFFDLKRIFNCRSYIFPLLFD